jgi:methylase of polypeptide subunit release factors
MAVLAVLNGASHATCTDINNEALQNAEENVMKHNLADRITIKYSDVFSGLNFNDKFDIIFWNYPFGHINKSVEELDLLERALMDPFYKHLDIYIKNANEYLNPDGGKLFLGFSNTAGYPQTFEDIAKKYNWTTHLRNEIKSDTTPVMHIGMYELIKIEWKRSFSFVLFKLIAYASEPLIIKRKKKTLINKRIKSINK